MTITDKAPSIPKKCALLINALEKFLKQRLDIFTRNVVGLIVKGRAVVPLALNYSSTRNTELLETVARNRKTAKQE